MFTSKFITVVAILIFLATSATVVFQTMEMRDYNLFSTLKVRFFPPAPPAPAEVPAAPAANPAEAPAAQAPDTAKKP